MSPLLYPAGRKPGCLPRSTKVGAACPLMADHIPVIPVSEWTNLIGEVELRDFVNKIKDQLRNGSCACESSTQGVEIVQSWEGLDWVELNPLFVYHHTNGGADNGSSIDTNLEFIRENGIAPESLWPRSKGWEAKPSDEAYEAAKLYRIEEFYDITSTAEVGTALLLGMPVVFGWSGHSCVLTQLLNTTTAEYANSWSPEWGDHGFGRISLSSINFGYGAFAIRTATINTGV
jgi:hypothetical protein